MIRVLHVGLSSNTGGIENVVRSWNQNLPDDIAFDFINVENQPLAYEEELKSKGAKIFTIPSRKCNAAESYAELKEIIEKGNYDYVQHHIMSYSWPEPTLIACKTKCAKAIVHSHSVIRKESLSFKYKLMHRYGRLRLSPYKYYRLACGMDAGLTMFGNNVFEVIENGIEILKFSYSETWRDEIRNRHLVKNEEFLVGHVGRWGAPKNYPFIYETFKKLHKKVPNTKLILIGDVEREPVVGQMLNDPDIKNSVICTGRVNQSWKYYSAMDVFFMPSLWEGVSVALIEAQASGLKCVVSKNVSKESAISDNVDFVNVENTDEAVEKLSEILENPYGRSDVTLDPRYDIKVSSVKMFDFFRAHLK